MTIPVLTGPRWSRSKSPLSGKSSLYNHPKKDNDGMEVSLNHTYPGNAASSHLRYRDGCYYLLRYMLHICIHARVLQEGCAIPACALVTLTGRHTSFLPVFTVQDILIGTLPFDPASLRSGRWLSQSQTIFRTVRPQNNPHMEQP